MEDRLEGARPHRPPFDLLNGLFRRLDEMERAREAYGAALDLTQNRVEREFILGRIADLTPIPYPLIRIGDRGSRTYD